MDTTEEIICCKLAAPGVEVALLRADDGTLVSVVHGGPLDGERLPHDPDTDPKAAQRQACDLARIAAVEEDGRTADVEAQSDRGKLLVRMLGWQRRGKGWR